MPNKLIGEAVNLWNGAVAYWRDRRKCAEIRRDLAILGPDESRRLLDEYCLTPEEFDAALRIPFASEDLSSSALRSVGLDPVEFHRQHGARSRAMRRNCTTCRAKYRCRNDLAAGSFEGNHQEYCPNRLHFAVLLARRSYQPRAAK